ncbi:tail fiber assembly protein [Escherichia coli]|uniref:tail fiber assembly protein n=1 Tax=Escherichia coli TaxID=562 RepID=UPI001F3438D4|nr:tail fiber assembly protein [Escherichia coli]MCF6636438.1 tail fiber assembly protein [Escherichia coli]
MKSTIFFSPSINGFYDSRLLDEYKASNTLPDDAIEMTSDEVSTYYMVTPPSGKRLGVVNNRPAWVDIPPPTQEELVAVADVEKQKRIHSANDYMNNKQWPGKAAIGRLKGDELAQYNLWLDYLDALELVDTSSAPDIEWPTPPAVQAR